MKSLIVRLLFCSLVILTFHKPTTVIGEDEQQIGPIDYSLYANILDTYVDNQGKVNYAELKINRTALDQFIDYIKRVDVTTFSEFEKKAFWLNAYNALTLQTIIDSYPVKSIRHINFGLVWEVPKSVAKNNYSLGHIEHKIIRPMGDPRIHFALNCASNGCPKLPREPFYPDVLDQQLNRETSRFVNDKEKVNLDRTTKTLYYSSIFNWFKQDFLLVSPDIFSYIKKYLNKDDLKFLEKNKVSLKALSYDWGLNQQ